MRTFNFSIGQNKYKFVCFYASERDGFKHKAVLLLNGAELSKAVCHYCNRTWERYTYQSAMKEAVQAYINKNGQNSELNELLNKL